MILRTLPAAARGEAATSWRELEARLESRTLACSWAWTETWLEHFGDVVDHRFVIAERAGVCCAAALVTHGARSRLRPRTVHVGTAGEPYGESIFVERNRLLAGDEDRPAFAAALLRQLERDGGWDRLCLDGMLPTDAAHLLAGRTARRQVVDESPVTDLRPGGDVLDALPASRRQRARRALRAFGELDVEWAASGPRAGAFLDELIDLHQADWEERGERGAFASARVRGFHRALVGRLVPDGRAALLRVRRDGETVACLYGLVEGRRLLFYQAGLRRYGDNRLRAGQAGHVCFMRACRERGLHEYDFLAPSARYKRELATHVDQLVWAEVERPSWRTGLSRARGRLERRP